MRQFFRNLWIRGQIDLLLLLIAAVALITYLAFDLAEKAYIDSSYKMMSTISNARVNALTQWIQERQQDILSLAQFPDTSSKLEILLTGEVNSPEYKAAQQSLQSLAVATSRQVSDWFAIDIHHPESGIILVSTTESRQGSSVASLPYYNNATVKGYLQPVYENRDNNQPVMTVSVKVLSERGEPVGVIAGHIQLERLETILGELTGLGQTGTSYLVDVSNRLISLSGTSYTTGVRSSGIDAALSKQNSQGMYENYRGELVVGDYRWVDSVNLAMITEVDHSQAVAPAHRIGGIILAAIVLMTAVLYFFVLIKSSGISSRLRELLIATTRVADGNFDMSITARARGVDEVGFVINGFNRMLAGLRQYHGNIQSQIRKMESEISLQADALENRTEKFQAAAEISKTAAAMRDLKQLLAQITRMISRRFGYYHVGIFLLDETGEYAILRAANSDGGQRMLARNHMLKIGEVGFVGHAISEKQVRIAQDVRQDTVFYDNPDLPNTRSEIAIPLIAGGSALGVLDLQSTESNAFSTEDIEVLEMLADQLAIAVENARLYTENQEVLEGIRRAYGEMSRQDWQERLQQNPNLGYICSAAGTLLPVKQDWTDEMIRTLETGEPVQVDRSSLIVPIKIRDQATGIVKYSKPDNAPPWTQDEIQTVHALTDQLSVALESARLYRETQERAEREHLQSEIVGKIRQTSSIDTILQTTIQELARALNLSEAAIQLRAGDGGLSS